MEHDMDKRAPLGHACSLGTAPTQEQSIVGVLVRALHLHITVLVQLLLGRGSTQPTGSLDIP